MSYVAKLQKWSNYSALHRFDVKTIKTVELRRKTFKTTQTTKVIKLQCIASIWRQNDPKCWVTSQNIQNYKSNQIIMHCIDLTSKRSKLKSVLSQNYESDQIIMHCIDLTSKRSKMLSYVAKHSKQRKTTKVIKL